jgi:hypothetical protein
MDGSDARAGSDRHRADVLMDFRGVITDWNTAGRK